MFDTIAGLPLHPLVVHAVEVVVPAAALTVLLAALWPRFRRWAYGLPLLLSLGGLVLVPVATQSGEALEERVGETPAVEAHTSIAEGLLPWVIGLVVVAAALAWWVWTERRAVATPAAATTDPGTGRGASRMASGVPRWLGVVVLVAALVASGGTTYEAIRIGHSGAKAVWGQTAASSPSDSGGDSDGDDD